MSGFILVVIFCVFYIIPLSAEKDIYGNDQTYQPRTAEFYRGTPKIDGVIDDIWEDVPSYRLTMQYSINEALRGEIDDISKIITCFQGMWDEDYLYILMYINVKPGTAEYENDHTTKVPWENNSLNFFINSDNTHAGNYKPDDFYWLMHPYGNIRSKNVSNNANASSVKVTEDGYVAEAKINIALLTANINPQAGEKFGFDASSNINLMSHGRNITLIWCSINSRLADSTREFGEVKLVMRPVPETDATESTYEEAGGETDVAPGDYNDSENYPGWDYDDYSEEPAATDVVNFGPALAIGILAVVLAGVALNIKRLVGLLIARKNKTGG